MPNVAAHITGTVVRICRQGQAVNEGAPAVLG